MTIQNHHPALTALRSLGPGEVLSTHQLLDRCPGIAVCDLHALEESGSVVSGVFFNPPIRGEGEQSLRMTDDDVYWELPAVDEPTLIVVSLNR